MVTSVIKTNTVSYEDIASEYYDPFLHPTCANFREASAHILDNWLSQTETAAMQLCEVGAGNSLLAELLNARNKTYQTLYITDISSSMLAHSKKWANENTYLYANNANDLSFKDESIDLLVSSLGDPYNTSDFWDEAYRVLSPTGTVMFTTPSYEWARNFRQNHHIVSTETEFLLSNGESVRVPSFIYPKDHQLSLMSGSNLQIKDYISFSLSKLRSKSISPKLLIENNSSVVEGYLASKI